MSIIYRKDRVSDGVCEKCGKIGEVNGDLCNACSAEKCFKRRGVDCSCNINNTRKKGQFYLPCFKEPICKALKAKDENWRWVRPLDEVPYNGIVGE